MHAPAALGALLLAALAALASCASAEGDGGGTSPRPDAAPLPDGGAPLPDGGVDAAPDISAAIINELVANHTGVDSCEYVEVLGPAGADLTRLSVLVLDGDIGGDPGRIDLVLPVGPAQGGGRWVSARLDNQLDNNSKTLLLVADLTGAAGDDLDEDDDGQLDAEPWGEQLDAVAMDDGGALDRTYAADARLDPMFDGLGQTVGGASRVPDGVDTGAASDWVRNAFGGEGLGEGCPVAEPPGASGEAANTPGAGNAVLP